MIPDNVGLVIQNGSKADDSNVTPVRFTSIEHFKVFQIRIVTNTSLLHR